MKMSDIFDASIDYILGLSDVRKFHSTDEPNLLAAYRSLPSKEKSYDAGLYAGY